MHDQLIKTDFMERHVVTMLREGRPAPKANRRFRMGNKENSPVREYARRRFRQSLLSMVSEVYRPVNTLPEEVI